MRDAVAAAACRCCRLGRCRIVAARPMSAKSGREWKKSRRAGGRCALLGYPKGSIRPRHPTGSTKCAILPKNLRLRRDGGGSSGHGGRGAAWRWPLPGWRRPCPAAPAPPSLRLRMGGSSALPAILLMCLTCRSMPRWAAAGRCARHPGQIRRTYGLAPPRLGSRTIRRPGTWVRSNWCRRLERRAAWRSSPWCLPCARSRRAASWCPCRPHSQKSNRRPI